MSNLCRHFGVCGGCALQNIAYERQLKNKTDKVAALLAPYYGGALDITPSPQTEYFRNKIELSFSRQVLWREPAGKKILRDKTLPPEFEDALGFRLKGRWDRCVDLRECILFNPQMPPLLAQIRAWAAKNNLGFYDQRKHTGALRNILMREGKNTGEGMLVLISATLFNAEGLVEIIEKFYPNYSVLTALNAGVSDAAGLSEIKILKGGAQIKESINNGLRDLFFELSPQSFFQTNTKAANLMYGRVREFIEKIKPQTLYDFYGGAGSFSLFCADLCGKVLCVESVEPAVINGRRNAQINKIDNVDFFCNTTEDFLAANKISAFNSAVILDPPRSGLHPKAAKAVLESGVKDVLYISCNPVTLAENLKTLGQKYKVTHAQCFDFFPHTEHVETLVILRHCEERRGAAIPLE
ncbi:MAG: 23S rRNA (uracil(1939)-C(5))-methyltransferase RlmD [Elusimicrobiota bacterium]|jgi:23S rRNA (uracil1939-C5)-methyltransferase|nr:23S rRNA (uracil(1939)-C(5))-methyltransferase RlmD [Elusimicrobiota bacterium]